MTTQVARTRRVARTRMSLTRRRLLGSGLAIGTAALTGCGDDDPGGAGDSGAADGFPVTIDGAFGPTRIDEPPRRVVAVGILRDGDDALALGVTPIAMPVERNSGDFAPWTRAALGAQRPERLNFIGGPPFEQIAAARPDLVLATDDVALQEHHAQLARIAPTLAYVNGAQADPWRERARRIGQALGRSQQANAAIAKVEGQLGAARQQHPEFAGKTFTIGVVSEGTVYAVSNADDAAAALLGELGLELTPQALRGDFPNREAISPERLDLLEGDVLILNFVSDADRRGLESNALFTRLDVVRRGAFIPLEIQDGFAGGYPSLLSIPYYLERIVPLLAKSLAT